MKKLEDICIIGNLKENFKFIKSIHEKVEEKLNEKVQLIGIKITKFRDCEIKVKIEENVREKQCFFIHDSSIKPVEWFTQLALTNYALKYASAKKVIDVLPYLLFSRQDRKDESRVAINAKVVADVISLYADRVITVDLHAPQIQGFYNIPLDNLYSFPYAIRYIFNKYPEMQDNLVIMSPDVGGVERAKAFLKRFTKEFNKNSELVFSYKHRPKEGEISEYKLVGNVKDKNVLIVDDIVDSGNTLINASETLRKNGANKIFAYATHAIFSEGVEKLKPYFDKFFISNTRNINNNYLEIVDLTDLFAEAIFRIYTQQSLSQLFE
ncbi:MAG: ribose-phosphate diphosphokinase [Candidatus Pacearchaeota archaeon]